MKPNRGLSDWIWNNPHIDDMQKAQMMPLVRGKEETIAQLETTNAELLEACRTAFDYLCDSYEDSEAFKISQILEQAIRNNSMESE